MTERVCKNCEQCEKSLEDRRTIDDWEEYAANLPQYPKIISNAILTLGKAVETAMNKRDLPVIAEMKRLCNEIFEQAELALNDNKRLQ